MSRERDETDVVKLDRNTRFAALATVAALGFALGGCEHIHDHKGYVIDSQLVGAIQPGVDNRDSVIKTLGHPSLASEFDGGANYYYWARDTRSFGAGLPKPTAQTMLTVRFARSGDVSAVQKTGTETIRKVSLYRKETPTLGRSRSFFAELFGNLGTSAGQRAPSADNPNGK
jgi:outer membrane protein assembly factor BamE (lipoprotein component of BamABCDE complex)